MLIYFDKNETLNRRNEFPFFVNFHDFDGPDGTNAAYID